MNYQYEKMQGFIKDLEAIGTNDLFLTLIDKNCPNTNIEDFILSYLGDKLETEFVKDSIECVYKTLDDKNKKEVVDELINRLKFNFLYFKREKIQLISKRQLREAIKHWEGLAKIYGYNNSDVRILKTSEKYYNIENKYIQSLLGEDTIFIDIKLNHSKYRYAEFEMTGFAWIHQYATPPYEFIIRMIKEINEKNKFIEFIWDKDE